MRLIQNFLSTTPSPTPYSVLWIIFHNLVSEVVIIVWIIEAFSENLQMAYANQGAYLVVNCCLLSFKSPVSWVLLKFLSYLCMSIVRSSFYVNLTQVKIIWEEVNCIEKILHETGQCS